jgi:DNA-binding IclR family transcriptional regulator
MARLAKTASTDAEAAPPGTLAVQRALTVMKCFQEGELERRLSSIARDTGLSVSTTHRLLAALCEEGFLRQDPDTERYSIGPTLALLGQRSASAAGLDLAQSVLAGLTRRTGESSTLAIRSGGEALVIAVSSSAQRLRFDHGVGTRLPLHASAMGKVFSRARTPTLPRRRDRSDRSSASPGTPSRRRRR